MKKKSFIFIVMATLIVLTGCQFSTTASDSDSNTTITAAFYKGTTGDELFGLKVGDDFMGMKLESLSLNISPSFKSPSEVIFDDENNWKENLSFTALFKGDIVLTGNFYIFDENGLFPGQGYLVLDKDSLSRIPVYSAHRYYKEIDFTNSFYFYNNNILLLNNTPQDISVITDLSSAYNIPCQIVLSSYSCNTIESSLPYNYGTLKSIEYLS